MTSRYNWNVGKPFTETADYVNLSPALFQHKEKVVHKQPTKQPNTPCSRPIKDVKTTMPTAKFFTALSYNSDDIVQSDSPSAAKANLPLLGAGLLKPNHVAGLPISKPTTEVTFRVESSTSTGEPPTKKKRRIRIEKPGPKDGKRILFCTVDHFIRWNKIARAAKQFFLYEVVGTLEGSTIKGCLQMLILQGDLGQRIQGLYYSIDRRLPPLIAGATYSMVGKVIASKILMVMDVNEIQPDEKAALPRLAFFCQRALNIAVGNPPDTEL
ncbi:Hypothetical protein NTJ_00650 [Nesidiocoris tenuis]|uniref:Uncharacterized protein n=1 Tax=Nesidiocoris tenuis TaxID=355587 RepID=A0ABN7A998_9HEMI|nr:Hypothetical protein NTJ_00650 [Nesidiocoris tenuis]